MEALEIIRKEEGIRALDSIGAEIYLVGGVVRDHLLGKKSKDIDIIVRLLDDKTIVSTLEPYGKVDKVGESFGVIKFTPKGWTGEPIDIAQPRIDSLLDKSLGHKGIKAEFDPFITIEEDLNRRDCRLNSIAMSWNGEIIDPFGGLEDIKNKIIRATSPKAFAEDPLRMLRCIQFSSRFKFSIADETWSMILENKSDIKSISGERIAEELEKIFYKGDIQWGLRLLADSGIHAELFDKSMICDFISQINTIEDFFFTICTSEKVYMEKLKGETKIARGIKAIQKCYELSYTTEKKVIREKLFEAIQISDTVLESKRLPFFFKESVEEFKKGKFPKSFKELAVNGDDLISLGLKGIEIGNKLKSMMSDVLSEVKNNIFVELLHEGTDKILIAEGEMFDGTRDQFRDSYFDNATDYQITDWCKENEWTLKINDKSILP